MYDNSNKEFVTKTLRHIGKLNGLVSDLLDVSKIQAGKLQLNISSFNMNELINEVMETVQHSSASHALRNVSASSPVIVSADRERIEQVVTNLMTNAIKYSPGANEVIVNSYTKDGHCIVAIQDFGIGISSSNLEKVFTRFYRVEGLEPHFSGLGIGLYIAYEIVRRHNGEMWVESEEGKGSTFFFKL